jgi:hypothetical protein
MPKLLVLQGANMMNRKSAPCSALGRCPVAVDLVNFNSGMILNADGEG